MAFICVDIVFGVLGRLQLLKSVRGVVSFDLGRRGHILQLHVQNVVVFWWLVTIRLLSAV